MKVKVGDTIYNSSDQPIMVIFANEDEKHLVSVMPEGMLSLAEFETDIMTEEQVTKWMEEI